MVALSLKICVRQCNVVKTMQFEPSTAIYDACRIIRDRVPEAQTGQGENSNKAVDADSAGILDMEILKAVVLSAFFSNNVNVIKHFNLDFIHVLVSLFTTS